MGVRSLTIKMSLESGFEAVDEEKIDPIIAGGRLKKTVLLYFCNCVEGY